MIHFDVAAAVIRLPADGPFQVEHRVGLASVD